MVHGVCNGCGDSFTTTTTANTFTTSITANTTTTVIAPHITQEAPVFLSHPAASSRGSGLGGSGWLGCWVWWWCVCGNVRAAWRVLGSSPGAGETMARRILAPQSFHFLPFHGHFTWLLSAFAPPGSHQLPPVFFTVLRPPTSSPTEGMSFFTV